MLSLAEIRNAFWEDHPQHADHFDPDKHQNDYPADIRADWFEYLDRLGHKRIIDQRLAQRATL